MCLISFYCLWGTASYHFCSKKPIFGEFLTLISLNHRILDTKKIVILTNKDVLTF